jgi:hypothetical protein
LEKVCTFLISNLISAWVVLPRYYKDVTSSSRFHEQRNTIDTEWNRPEM